MATIGLGSYVLTGVSGLIYYAWDPLSGRSVPLLFGLATELEPSGLRRGDFSYTVGNTLSWLPVVWPLVSLNCFVVYFRELTSELVAGSAARYSRAQQIAMVLATLGYLLLVALSTVDEWLTAVHVLVACCWLAIASIYLTISALRLDAKLRLRALPNCCRNYGNAPDFTRRTANMTMRARGVAGTMLHLRRLVRLTLATVASIFGLVAIGVWEGLFEIEFTAKQRLIGIFIGAFPVNLPCWLGAALYWPHIKYRRLVGSQNVDSHVLQARIH